MDNKQNKTRVECYLTSCVYNTACCITSKEENYCTKNQITIDIDKDDEDCFNFGCVSFENGYKDDKCVECQMEENDGEIPIEDYSTLELDIIDYEDDDFI